MREVSPIRELQSEKGTAASPRPGNQIRTHPDIRFEGEREARVRR